MATDSRTDVRIDLPSEFADHLAAVGNLETASETVGEYWSKFADQLAASDQTIEPEGLYVEEPTRHEVRVDAEEWVTEQNREHASREQLTLYTAHPADTSNVAAYVVFQPVKGVWVPDS